jgi:alkylation response protein AidB-like acyl-CoA dehydrogenase
MEFGLSDAQVLLRDSIRGLLAQSSSIERVREIMDTDDAQDPELLRALGEQGVTGLLIDERWGGVGLGLLDAAMAAQEMGRAVTPLCFDTSFVLAPLLLEAAASDEQKERWLSGIAGGETLVAPLLGATFEGGHLRAHDLSVPAAHVADALLVQADEHAWLIPRDAQGVEVRTLFNVDETRRFAEVTLDLEPDEDWRLADSIDATHLDRAIQAARIVLAADALGACYRAIEIAVEYAQQREQFGRIIASFQAVKHLCAEMIADVDPVQSLVWQAAWSWDQEDPDAAWLAPLLKAHASEVGTRTVTTATQVFGGMGFTWECDMHLYYKRVGYDRQMLGGPVEMRALAAERQFGAA